MNELLDAYDDALRALARDAAEAMLRRAPTGFALYAVPIAPADIARAMPDADLDGAEPFVAEHVAALAVSHLQAMQREGRLNALTTGAHSPVWRAACRTAATPLVRLLVDEEFVAATPDAVHAALAEARTLAGWSDARPPVVTHAV